MSLAESCIARHTCKYVGVRCSPACRWHIDLTYQIELAGVPDEYRDIVVERLPDDFEHIDKLRAFATVVSERKPKNGLYVYSPGTGNGKTFAAAAIVNSFIVARTRKAINNGQSISDPLAVFVNVVDLLDLLRASMDDERSEAKATRLIERIEKAQLVVLDDIGANRPSPWVEERFYSIINGIWTRKASQTLVVTSNVSLDALELTLGPRVRSRVEGLTLAIEFTGDDYRRKGRK